MKKSTVVLLIALVVALTVAPLLLLKGAAFEGADGMAEDVVAATAPGYEPWFKPLMEPASGEIESMLFALQAAIGAGFIGYYIGRTHGQKSADK